MLSCRASVERNAEGSPIRLVGTVQDVTDLREAEQRMGRATQRYLDLVSISPVGVGVAPGLPAAAGAAAFGGVARSRITW